MSTLGFEPKMLMSEPKYLTTRLYYPGSLRIALSNSLMMPQCHWILPLAAVMYLWICRDPQSAGRTKSLCPRSSSSLALLLFPSLALQFDPLSALHWSPVLATPQILTHCLLGSGCLLCALNSPKSPPCLCILIWISHKQSYICYKEL